MNFANLTQSQEEENLSRVYVHLVATRAGMTYYETKTEFGIDGIFRPLYRVTTLRPNKGKNGGTTSPYQTSDVSIDYQIKSTFNWTLTAESVKFKLESDDYDRLVDKDGRISPVLLILFCLPSEKATWVEFDEDRLSLRKCCYWMYLEGEKTKNKSSVTVTIPRSNLFTPAALSFLMQEKRLGGATNANAV